MKPARRGRGKGYLPHLVAEESTLERTLFLFDHPIQTFQLEREEFLSESSRLNSFLDGSERYFAKFVPDTSQVFVIRVEVE